MKLKISHETKYTYDKPVQLNPHQLFLRPLARGYFDVLEFKIHISPHPVGLNERSSIEGNPYFQVWFDSLSEQLDVVTETRLVSRSFDPFAFVIDSSFIERIDQTQKLVFRYEEEELFLLLPYLKVLETPFMDRFIRDHLTGKDTVAFLMDLNAAIYRNWVHIIREEENLWEPQLTFEQKQGSCRDLAWMMIHMLRSVGLAARFVSGYAFNPELEVGHELHAWVEAYLPGGGWVGMDPSLGLLADEHYIPLACSYHPFRTLPVHGTVGGQSISQSHLFTKVEIILEQPIE